MTDKNLKQEECTIAVKAGSRVHTSASLHTLSQPNATAIAPHGGYSMPTEVVHHAHLPYRMLQPSFQTYPLSLSGPMPTPKPGHISNDLGPPIFMPPLNLGIPKSSQTVGKLPQLTLPSSSVAPPTSLHPTHLDRTSSPSIITSFPGLVTPSGGGYNATPMLHPSHQPYPLNSSNSKSQMLTKTSSNQMVMMSEVHVDGNKMAVAHCGGINHSSSSSLGFVSKNLISQNAGLGVGPLIKQQTAVTKATSGLMGDLSHYQQVPVNKSIVNKLPKESANEASREMGVVDALLGVSMASGLGSGNVLVCTEGLPPPVPRNMGSVTSDMMKSERSHLANHVLSDSYHGISNSLQDSQIPWPEAVSKNIIIPAPNLTGKDIANLTSATSSPIATNDRTGNDVSWLPLSDNHTHQTDNHTPPSSMDSLSCSSGIPHESQTGSSGMSIVSQNAIASPRPSILRKRGFDSRPVDVPPSSSMHKFLRQRSQGSPCDHSENHCVKDEVSSPRKRPRKQHLYIDSVNEHHFPSQNQQDTDHTPKLDPAHNSMIANERLLGPLPLKEKRPCVSGESSDTTDKQNKDGGIIYVSQLRRSQHPMMQLCRRPRNAARNHFRRHADIKHTEEESISPHEACSQTSTWLRSSGWKLQHFNGQLQKIEQYESDMLNVMDRLKDQCELVVESMTEDELETKHRTFLRETMMGNIERIKRSRLHTQETRESMMKILDVNGKVVDIMKKFATHLPTKLLTTSTSVTDSNAT